MLLRRRPVRGDCAAQERRREGGVYARRPGRPRLVGAWMDLAANLAVVVGAARALAALHARGTVHGHLSPAALVVDPTGGAVLLADPPPGPVAPAYAYMAPEQTGRLDRVPDARADLYA